MKPQEIFDKIREKLEPEADFFGGEAMGSLQKAYYCKGIEKALSVIFEVEEEFEREVEHER